MAMMAGLSRAPDAPPVQSELVAPCYFGRPHDGFVKLGSEALATMLAFTQLAFDAKEAGGVLIGRHILGTNDVVVDEVTTPLRGDRRGCMSFHRARERHQKILDAKWRQSKGTRVYLGEWHTHAEPVPMPSSVDMNDWRRRLLQDTVEAPFLFFLIVGQSEIQVWEGSRTSFGITPLPTRD